MTKYTTEQDKIEAWMKKKNEWADHLISLYPNGTTFTKFIDNSQQIQSSITRIQQKLKYHIELIPPEYEYMTDRAKAISNYYSNYNRYV